MDNPILQMLLEYGYVIMFFLMYLEGPIVTMAAAFLASIGHFNVWAVLAVSILGDITGDIVLYWVGRRWGAAFVRGPGKYLGIREPMIAKMQRFFVRHGGATIFAVKSTTGLCFVTFVAAGMARMDFKKFLAFSFLGGIVWSSTLVFVGYVFGSAYEIVAQYISWAGWLIGFLAIAFFIGISIYKKHQAKQLLRKEKAKSLM